MASSGNSANLPAPFEGQNTKTPNAVLKSPFCETLYNFNTTEAGISLRKGDSVWATKSLNSTGGVTSESPRGFIPYGQTKLFQNVFCIGGGINDRYYDISTSGGAPSLAYTSAFATSSEIFYTYFNKRVFTYSIGNASGDYYDGTAWGSWGYTMPATYNPIGGCQYKHRQYFIFANTSSYGYSEIDAVTGAVTLVPLGGAISEDAGLAIITPITISNETSSVKLLCFVFFSGEVLFYSGSYPDSDNWDLVASASVGPPLNYNSVLSPYQGDSLLVCQTGLISLRDLFLRGSEQATNLALSEDIMPDWVNMITVAIRDGWIGASGRFAFFKAAWWKLQNRIVISFPITISSSNTTSAGSTYFIYDTLRQAWSVHRSFGLSSSYINDITVFKNQLLISQATPASSGVSLIVKSKEGATDFQDVSGPVLKSSYDYDMLSAPVPFPKTAVYESDQIEPIMQSDLWVETSWNFIADFGRQSSSDQPLIDQGSSVAKPAVNTGMQNITYVQIRMHGTTNSGKTIGLDLYSYNVWFNSGEKGSR